MHVAVDYFVVLLLPSLQQQCHGGADNHSAQICWDGGLLVCCDECPASYHFDCLGMTEEVRMLLAIGRLQGPALALGRATVVHVFAVVYIHLLSEVDVIRRTCPSVGRARTTSAWSAGAPPRQQAVCYFAARAAQMVQPH